MIVVRLQGGLGNQMLQYAVGMQLATIHHTPLYLDLSWFSQQQDVAWPREFKLHQFHTSYRLVNLQQLSWRLRFTSHLPWLNPFKLKNVRETPAGGFDETILNAGDHVLLEGFYNGYRYFEQIRPALLREFEPIEHLEPANQQCLQRIQACNAVSVHIRRGDYALTDFHGMLGVDYYNEAIRYVAKKAGSPVRLFIFSDEPEWVMQHMEFTHPFEIISHNKDEKNYRDMQLMKHCKHNIIANSTFSWWGAWLNENEEQMVVAPQNWSNDQQLRIENGLLLPGWITI